MTRVSSRASLIKTARDLRILRLDVGRVIVVGCDSAGGIGPKPLDRIRVDGRTVGRFTARVALMEVLSVGAKPVCLSNTLAVEPKPTGIQITKGIHDELRYARVASQIVVTGSSEKNVTVNQTGVGVTIVATATSESLKIGQCKRDDAIVAVGLPHVGDEVIVGEKKRRIADTRDVRILLNASYVHEIIPVGSQGALHEAQTIGQDSNLRFVRRRSSEFDLRKSAGPATVVLCACSRSHLKELSKLIQKPVNLIGSLG